MALWNRQNMQPVALESFCLCAGLLKKYSADFIETWCYDVMIGPTNQKNWLTFGGDLVPDTNSRSLLRFSHHCGMWNFTKFISISRSHWPVFTTLCWMTDAEKIVNPRHLWAIWEASKFGLIQKSRFEFRITSGWG